MSDAMAEDSPAHRETRPRPASLARQGSGAETGYAVLGTLISGMAVWGGAGWLLDRWLDIVLFFPVGYSCYQPWVKNLNIMANSIYNGWRMEDVWLDRKS